MDTAHDTIIVTELPDAVPRRAGACSGSVLGVYEQHGYDAGYRRAVQDVLLSLLEVTEEHIRRRKLPAAVAEGLRRAAWAVGEELQRDAGPRASAFVEGGLGI